MTWQQVRGQGAVPDSARRVGRLPSESARAPLTPGILPNLQKRLGSFSDAFCQKIFGLRRRRRRCRARNCDFPRVFGLRRRRPTRSRTLTLSASRRANLRGMLPVRRGNPQDCVHASPELTEPRDPGLGEGFVAEHAALRRRAHYLTTCLGFGCVSSARWA